jgi:hypothetical protein
MSQRVLATDQAVNSIRQIQAIVNGGLQNDIQRLKQLLVTLSDANEWDGPLAVRFRTEMSPQCRSAMDRLIQELEALRAEAQRILAAILAAGGIGGVGVAGGGGIAL